MIQVITTLAHATCKHCGMDITQGIGDAEREPSWWHRQTGKAVCPGSPVATPLPESVREADR